MKPRLRHKITYAILRPFFELYIKFNYGFKLNKYKLKGNHLVLSNHVTMFDPFFVAASFNFPIYFVASNDIFAYRLVTKIIKYLVEPISKTKNEVDFATIKEIITMSKAGGSIGLFLSGNATYSGTEEYIDSPIAKLVRKINLPVVLYNLKGLYGVSPRWGSTIRKGFSTGVVKQILSIEQISLMSDEELTATIKTGLSVSAFDLDNQQLNYTGKNLAQYLERALFVCPDCNSLSTLMSEDNQLSCLKCSYNVTYQPNLTFKLNRGKNLHRTVKDWYDFQKNYVQANDFSTISENQEITHDAGIDLLINIKNVKKEQIIENGSIHLYSNRVEIKSNNVKIILSFDDILAMAVHVKNRLLINTPNHYYQIINNKRRSALKYMFIYYSIVNRKAGIKNGFLGI
jgi:DNA-directed RNA polymerase subunit RPC12/RpoP